MRSSSCSGPPATATTSTSRSTVGDAGSGGFLAEITGRDETRTGFRIGPAELAAAVVDGLLVQTIDRAL